MQCLANFLSWVVSVDPERIMLEEMYTERPAPE